ncbi:hypothetical protein PENSPDRAFT_49570 [Peniophora sp. CONT]|nr:hypothetical protein PENSPDRAFT_49570 [Peniophora sp. CONT]
MSSTFAQRPFPLDLIYAVLELLPDRRDLHAAALTNWDWNRAATPLLYRTLDSDTRSKKHNNKETHPANTLLKRPELARHVRHVHEAGFLHKNDRQLTALVLRALRLCVNIQSFSWVDDGSSSSPDVWESFLDVLVELKPRELTIRSYSDLGERIWGKLNTITGLHKVVVWCMEGKPRILQDWAERLSDTLTALELGRCAGVPATLLVDTLAQLPLLRELTLKGAPSQSMHNILMTLPKLEVLDVEYLGMGALRPVEDSPDMPRLRRLTIRTSSVDLQGPRQLWAWIRQLIPRPSLESFTLNAFSTQGYMTIPRHFLLSLARTHGETLQSFLVNMSQLTLEDVECICSLLPHLRELSCATTSPDPLSLKHAILKGKQLESLKVYVAWIPTHTPESVYLVHNTPSERFGKEEARELMFREDEGGCRNIRVLSVGPQTYVVSAYSPPLQVVTISSHT